MGRSVIFVDWRVADIDSLVASMPTGSEVCIIDGTGDGLDQIAARLLGQSGIDAIHIISHGSSGSLVLGTGVIDSATLASHASQLETIGKALTDSGDILLYGCNVAAGDVGIQFIGSLARATGADVAASTDITGGVAGGGNWVLESRVGMIESATLDALNYGATLAANTAPTFDAGDGKLTTVIGAGYDIGSSVTVQADGKILVAGTSYNGSNDDFALVRYNADGGLDTTFDSDGKLTTDFGASPDGGSSVTVQADGKILVAGQSWNGSNYDFALARYNADGSLDTTFDADGKLTTAIGTGDDWGRSATVQADGKILVAGYSWNGSNHDFALVRYNADGSLDSTFDADGKLTTAIGTGDDWVYSVTVQGDGKIVVRGNSNNGGNYDLALARYNADGSLDTTFDSDGKFSMDDSESATAQADGKRLQVSSHWNGSNYDFELARYNANGTPDTAFDSDGKLTTDFGAGNDYGSSVAVQADGKIVVGGHSYNGNNQDFALARYNADGSLDTTFDADGKATTDFGASWDYGYSITVQADGKILAAGSSWNGSSYDFALARYNADGSLDTTFDSDGKLTTAIGTSTDWGYSVIVQTDGKILVAGQSWNGSNHDFALVRYNTDGSLDTAFDADGKLTTDFGGGDDWGYSVTVQADGKIVVRGTSNNGGNYDLALARYNADGSLDTTFDGDGKFTVDDSGEYAAVQADGKRLNVSSSWNGSDYDIELRRYNANGGLDTHFDSSFTSTLDATVAYITGTAAVVLDCNAQIYDPNLAAAGNYAGAILTLVRQGGANASDVFSGSGALALSGGQVLVSGVDIGSFSQSGGQLDINFTVNATQARVDTALQSLAYSYTGGTAGAVTVAWIFSDGNTGAQGTGGALGVTGSSTVNVSIGANTVPNFGVGDGKLTTAIGAGNDYGNSVAVQADGKILVAGTSFNGSNDDIVLVRYNADGSLDPTFDGDGKLTTDFGASSDGGSSVTVQADGKILVAGHSGVTHDDFALARYNADGSLDTTFDSDGKLTTVVGTLNSGESVTVQADGKILVAGTSMFDFALLRYNADGSLDTTFDADGKLTTDFGSMDFGRSVTVQADGKILVVGQSWNGSNDDFAIVRYNADGSLDSSFDGDGKVLTAFGSGNDSGRGVALQSDGKIVVAGSTWNGTNEDFAIARYNVDGSLDTSFDGDGKVSTHTNNEAARSITIQSDGKILVGGYGDGVTVMRYNTDGSLDATFSGDGKLVTTIGSVGANDYGQSIVLQTDGKVVVAGHSYNGSNDDFALVRYNPDGSLDTHFDSSFASTLDASVAYTTGNAAVVLDGNVKIYDPNLAAAGNYAGATLTLARQGGANASDVFSGSGALALSGGQVLVSGVDIGSFTQSGGQLTIAFTGNATQARVDTALQSLAYSYTGGTGGAVTVAWSFSDGNTAVQGTGGVLSVTGSSTVNVSVVANTAPTFDLADGTLTTAIGTGNDYGYSVAVQADGKVLVAGRSWNGSNDDFALLRYNADGSFDTTFDGDGKLTTAIGTGNDLGWSVTVQVDGKILVAGESWTGGNDDFALVRYNADGSLDTTFDADGKLSTDFFESYDWGKSVTVQADGKILVGGSSWNGSNYDFALVRYSADGSLDTSFDADGKLTTAIGTGNDRGSSVTVQADGKILVEGESWNGSNYDFALARYNADGSLDTTFDNDGKFIVDRSGENVAFQADGKRLSLSTAFTGSNFDFELTRYNTNNTLDTTFGSNGKFTTDFAAGDDWGHSVTVQADGKILVVGQSWNGSSNDFALARYNADGSVDTTFDADGKLTTDFGASDDSASSVTAQADGKILVVGNSWNGSTYDFALVRYNADGSLDASFDADGKLTTDFGASDDYGNSVTVQTDGKILVAGQRWNGSNDDFALVRYNTDGSLDTTFDTDGKLTTDFGGGNDSANSVTLQADGKILVAGQSWYEGGFPVVALALYNADGSLDTTYDGDGKFTEHRSNSTVQADGKRLLASNYNNGSNSDFALTRYNLDGSPDTSFDSGFANTLDAVVTYTIGTAAVVMDYDAHVVDAELAAADNYAGASLTIRRQGGPNVNDQFSGTGVMEMSGGQVLVWGTDIGSYTQSGGQLAIAFTGNAMQWYVDTALHSLAYSYTGSTTGAVAIEWIFSDGNTGAQGVGGALSVTGTTTVNVSFANTAPILGDGKLTTDFGLGSDSANSVTVQADGKILVAGYAYNGTDYDFALVRYNADGSLDTTFNVDGKLTTDFGGGNQGNSVTLQADGKILVAGGNGDFAVARYNADGSLDTTFDADGKLTTDFASGADYGYSITVQSDGKILVAGNSRGASSTSDFALARYNADGSLDTTFDSDGRLTTDFGASDVFGGKATLQADGKILVAGTIWHGSLDFVLVRYNADGSLDTTFDADGKLTTAVGVYEDWGQSVTVQADGKILVAGFSRTSSTIFDFALARYNVDGSLDTSFDTDGKLTTDFGAVEDLGYSVTVQADGKILVAGEKQGITTHDFALARYNTDGSLDSTFDGDGKITTAFGGGAGGQSVAVQADGKVLVAGTRYNDGKVRVGGTWFNGTTSDFAIVRYNADGSTDGGFGVNILDGSPTFTENQSPVVLDPDVRVYDAELALGNYAGASLTLARQGGPNAHDHFAVKTGGTLEALTQGGNLTVSGTAIGTVTANSGGVLNLAFNSNATQSLVDSALQQITYSNSSNAPPASVKINWTFSDGNTGAQGTGGALAATSSTTVTIIPTTTFDWSHYWGSADGRRSDESDYTSENWQGTADLWSINTVTGNAHMLVGDLDFDVLTGSANRRELIVADGATLKYFSASGAQIGGTIALPTNHGYMTLADIDGDQDMEVLVGSADTANTQINIYGGDGSLVKTILGPVAGGSDVYMSPAAYLGGGKLLVTFTAGYALSPRGFALYDINAGANGTQLWSFDAGPAIGFPSVADIDGDGRKEITASVFTPHNGKTGTGILGGVSDDTTDSTLSTIVLDENGTVELVATLGADTTGGAKGGNLTVLTDLEGDGVYEIVATVGHYSSYSGDTQIRVLNLNGTVRHSVSLGTNNYAEIAVADINGDGKQEIVALSAAGSPTPGNAYVFDPTLTLKASRIGGADTTLFNAADVDGDGVKEILTAGADGLHILNGLTLANKYSPISFAGSPTIASVVSNDLDGDGDVELIVTGSDNKVHVVDSLNKAPTFSVGDGKVTTDFGSTSDKSWGLAVQTDGKILLAGESFNGSNYDIALVRYNADGSLDTTFDGDGMLTTAIGANYAIAIGVTVQADGKILVGGSSWNGINYDFALARYNANGSLDTSFDADGKLTTDFGGGDGAYSVAVQANGKILVVGTSNGDFALVRYNADGSLDTTFDTDGKLTTAIGAGYDSASSVTVQADGRILVAGQSSNDFALVRYNADGSLDTAFDADGKLITDFGAGADSGASVTLQADGKILVAGKSYNGSNYDFALARYNIDGSLDTSFSSDGKLTTAIGVGDDGGYSIALQADGKILVSGESWNGINYDIALARYNANGSLDTSFDADGKLTTAIGTSNDEGHSVTLQADGKILVAGHSHNGSNYDFALVRYNADGSLDTHFDSSFASTLDATVSYTTGNAAVVLDGNVKVYDPNLAAAGNYAGATLTLARQGGANAGDVFSGSGALALSGGQVLVTGVDIGSFTQSGGQLAIAFTANATQARVDTALQSLAYSYTGGTSGAVTVAWSFSDGNTGGQGGGGPLTAIGSTTVNVTVPVSNVAPTAVADTATTTEDAGPISIAVLSNDTDPDAGDTKTLVSVTGSHAKISGGSLSWDPGTDYQYLAAGQTATDSFSYVMRDAAGLTGSATVTVTVSGANDAPVLKTALADQSIVSGTTFSLTLPADTFFDPDRSDLLTSTAKQADGSPLPTWLAWDNGSRSFSGTPTSADGGIYSVQLSVADPSGATASTTFKISVNRAEIKEKVATVTNVHQEVVVEPGQVVEKVVTTVDFTLPEGIKELVLAGTAQSGTGNADDNIIRGNDSGDVLDGLSGNDSLIGGAGQDTLDGGIGSDTLEGGAGDDLLRGGEGGDDLFGGRGNNVFSGGGGGDTVYLAGSRDDYLVDVIAGNQNKQRFTLNGLDPGDIVQLTSKDGRVEKMVGVEKIVFLGNDSAPKADSVAIAVSREGLLKDISISVEGGGYQADTQGTGSLTGDTSGQASKDVLDGLAGDDLLIGKASDDWLLGGEGSDTLDGGVGNDTLNGGLGTDSMMGGLGNDIYFVDALTDRVVEVAGGGNDKLIALLQEFTLVSVAEVESLEFGGDGSFTGSGNERSNTLIGNYGDDSLSGGGGADVLSGNEGNDTLDGGLGADRLIGGAGDDVYVVDNTADILVEKDALGVDSGGSDTVRTTLGSYALGNNNVENLERLDATLTTAFVAGGNTLGNRITGGAGNDTLSGLVGNDTLAGGGGNDKLLGGIGDDVLTGGAGNDTLDGGNDNDTAIVTGNRVDYVFSRPDVGKMHIARKGGTETDLLTGIEQVKFADGSTGQLTLDDLLKNTASKFDDSYDGDSGANVFDGLAGNDSILGGGGNDSLAGGQGHDTLDGGTGSDQLGGGLGNDVYIVDTAAVADPDPAKAIAGDVVSEALNAGIDKVQTSLAAYTLGANIEHLDYLGTPVAVLDAAGKPTGASQIQQLAFAGTGNDLANTITGGGGNDTLDGGKGADRLIGGTGDDTYLVDSYADRIVEKDGEGSDTLLTTLASYTLAGIANVENLSYANGGKFNGSGNELANRIAGGVGNDTLDGGKGDDTLTGGAGNDLLKGGDGTDTAILAGNRADYVFSRPDIGKVQVATKDATETDLLAGIEQIKFADGSTGHLNLDDLLKNTASKFDDSYEGGVDNDIFDGLAGHDSLLGGGGNDSLTGGLGNDTLDGGAGQDTLIGGKGDDVYVIDSTDEVVSENALEGADTIRTGLAGLALAANVERLVYVGTGNFSGTGNELNNLVTGGSGNDSLGGGLGADILQGGDGNDTLEGGDGTDRLEGGAGDDTYIVTSPADLVRETDATGSDTGGNDTLRAQTTGRYMLALNVENFAFDGADGVTASGNAGSNLISGGNGNDALVGGAGNDTLNGKGGADRLSGGLDGDVFVFDTAPVSGFDTITDFTSGEDKIQLDNAIFGELGTAGALNAEFFVEGQTALDANDYLVYDKATGTLWYDADGSGAGAAEQLALLANKAALAATDFSVG